MSTHAVMEDIAERAAQKALDGFFVRLGVDTSDPIAMQKDFAFVRGLREGWGDTKRRGILAGVTVAVSAAVASLIALLWPNAHVPG